jgi:hypothetical protein
MWRTLIATASAAGIVLAATATDAAARSVAMGGARGSVGSHHSVTGHASFTPRGFSHGRKIGWRGRHHPPGWTHGRKVGWHHAGMPPGLRR